MSPSSRRHSKSTKLRHSLEDKVVTAKVQAKALEKLRKVSEAQEAKLKEELQTFKDTTQELEAQVIEKDEAISKEQAWVTEMETKLADTDSKMMVMEA